MPPTFFETAAKFRAWLRKHHQTADELWVGFRKKKTGLASLYVYGAGTNLLTFSKFKLWDVELGSNGATYPLARTIVIGLRAQF